jgi:hypothetical protein
MPGTVEDIAYDESIRALDQQYLALSNLRARAGTVVAGASLVASFLGAPALKAGGSVLAVGIAVLALLAVLSLCGAILWPYAFEFRLSARVILEDHAISSPPTEVARLKGYLALTLERHHQRNERIINSLHNALACSLVFLGIETFALLAAVSAI